MFSIKRDIRLINLFGSRITQLDRDREKEWEKEREKEREREKQVQWDSDRLQW